jgi:predicted HTH domain antitoxin
MKVILEFNDVFAKKYTEHDLKMYCAVGLYKERIMGTGVLARAVGISRMEFQDEMHRYGSGILDMTKDELKLELENARKYLPK